MASKVRSIRADESEWASWVEAAGETSLNEWVRRSLNAAAFGQVEVKHSRDQLISVVRGRDLRTFRGPDWRK